MEKKIIIGLLLLIVIGAIVCVATGVIPIVSGESINKDLTNELNMDTLKKVDINMEEFDINICSGENYMVKYDCLESEEPTCEYSNNELKINQKSKGYCFFSTSAKSKLYITIPKSAELDSIVINTDESMELKDLDTKELSATVTEGSMDITNCGAESTTLENVDEKINIVNSNLGDLKITNRDGSIDISEGNYEKTTIIANDGSVKVAKSKFASADFITRDGNTDIKDCEFDNITIKGDDRKVVVSNSEFVTATVDSGNGDVYISSSKSLDNYSLDVFAEEGNIDIFSEKYNNKYIRECNGEKKITVKTYEGNITIN